MQTHPSPIILPPGARPVTHPAAHHPSRATVETGRSLPRGRHTRSATGCAVRGAGGGGADESRSVAWRSIIRSRGKPPSKARFVRRYGQLLITNYCTYSGAGLKTLRKTCCTLVSVRAYQPNNSVFVSQQTSTSRTYRFRNRSTNMLLVCGAPSCFN